MSEGSKEACGLCESHSLAPFAPSPALHVDCGTCGLVAVRTHLHPTDDAARERYLLHENSPADAGYRAFLARLVDPLCERMPAGAEGLDFGCGPGPTLSLMLEERGLSCALHDPMFAPNPAALARTWDFVACTEVVEHLCEPRATWRQLASLVRPGGVLAVMSQPLLPERESRFDAWAYARDPTHVALYRPRTVQWISTWLGLSLETPREDAWIMRRPE